MGLSLWGKEPITFLKDGASLTGVIKDLRGIPLKIEYVNGRKIPKHPHEPRKIVDSPQCLQANHGFKPTDCGKELGLEQPCINGG